jgi:hypothetical protein
LVALLQPGTVYKACPDGKRFRTAMNGNAHENTIAASSFTNDVSFNNNVTVSCASNNRVTMHSSTKGTTEDMTSKHLSMMICDCVETVLCRRVKFYKKRIHGLYDFRTGSVMKLVRESKTN